MSIILEPLTRRRRQLSTDLKNGVQGADANAQYDASAKRLLGNKNILAHILVKSVDEFKGMKPKEVAELIEGTPYISNRSRTVIILFSFLNGHKHRYNDY